MYSVRHAPRGEPLDRRRDAVMAAVHRQALRQADHACCCLAGPVVVAVMPPTPDRAYPTELLLCAHHYRASREALAASGATVFDRNGSPLLPQDAALVGAR